ncbi:MAG: hypothetical protein QOI07_1976 [Verrucomicrobiota bacterium]|jgi:hypothetical protein
MSSETTVAVAGETPARAYRRAHAGKLMVVEPRAGRELSSGDFFRLDDVGTHPTGLLVTGIFDDARRNHMMATAVRDATLDEIAWHDDSGF